MKKNRPGVQLAVLCEEAAVAPLSDLIFCETSAFGLRIEKVIRLKLQRRFEQVQTAFGPVTVKLGYKGERLLQVAPEFESCRALSVQASQPLRAIYAAAVRACEERQSG
jgi:uncharacterized protein (DUF111 family)